MRIALAVCRERISPVFDVARQVTLCDIENNTVTHRTLAEFAGNHLIDRANQLAAWEVNTLICGAISRPMADLLQSRNLQIVAFVSGPVEEVLQAWLTGELNLPRWAMPGCGRRRRRGQQCGRRQKSCEFPHANLQSGGTSCPTEIEQAPEEWAP